MLRFLIRRISYSNRLSKSSYKLPSTLISHYWDDIMSNSNKSVFPEHKQHSFKSLSTADDMKKLIESIVKSRREDGDIWPVLLCQEFCNFYDNCDLERKSAFLQLIAVDFGVDQVEVQKLIQKYNDAVSTNRSLTRITKRMKDVLTPAYESLFSRISQLPGGLFFLIRLRADTNYLIKSPYIQAHERFQLQTISESLKSKFQEWFALNKVELQRITWETPAVTLEKILNYEAVHSIASWLALKRRLGVGRFCFAFLHSSIPHEPLTFVQVATMDTIPRHISAILDDPSPTYSGAKVAIFYSITSAQKGLTGVDLGNFLIKRVVRKIQSEMPSVETFVTLSPIPGFRRWLNLALNNQENLLLSDEIKSIEKLSPCDKHSINENLKKWFYMDKLYSPEVENVLQPILLRLCAHYILHEKRRGFALDPVTNFHVRNGAYIQQLNWKGDISEKGFEQSFGIMINYNYKLHDIEENNQKYLLDGTIPILQPVSDTIKWAVDNQDLRTSNKL